MKNKVMIYTDFQIELDKNAVLDMMNCYSDSPVYEETAEEYEEVKQAIEKILDCKCVIAYDTILKQYEIPEVLPQGKNVFYTIVTIGKAASQLSEIYFQEGDCLKGMLADTIADAYVFAMEKQLHALIKKECKERKVGISHRYEAPANIPMEYQKVAFEITQAKEYLSMDITVGYMLNPLKSNCQVYLVTEDETEFKLEHDCRTCKNTTCAMRYIPPVELEIYDSNKEFQRRIICKPEESIWRAIIREGIYISAPCGGNGTCGKCKIQLIEGSLSITSSDETYFSKAELIRGYRLACQAYPEENCKLILPVNTGDTFLVLGTEETELQMKVSQKQESKLSQNTKSNCYKYGFAIDIGTTTIAISLINISREQLVDTYTGINHQSTMGADVISRIQQANTGGAIQLQKSIQKDLLLGIQALLKRNVMEESAISEMVISANTTMIHLLLGYSCKGLGVAPFRPVNIDLLVKSAQEVLNTELFRHVMVTILPGISTFVGGDIVSGIYSKKLDCNHNENSCTILVDLGTNGEMALVKGQEIYVTSTAMGPACEGGNITWGMGSVQGAISQVDLKPNLSVYHDKSALQVDIKTIGDKQPIGICGTGVLEIVAELLENELIDESGLLEEEYFDTGFPIVDTQEGKTIIFTQKDIREIQLAKSAIRAGIETLIKKANVTYREVHNVYLAGGFGFKINVRKAVSIGLFPSELSEKIEAVGNTSLQGAIDYLMHQEQQETERKRLYSIPQRATEVELSTDQLFNELYVTYMFFE